MLPGSLQLPVERDGLDEGADLAAHVLEEATVAWTERVARRIHLEPELAERRAAEERSTAVCCPRGSPIDVLIRSVPGP